MLNMFDIVVRYITMSDSTRHDSVRPMEVGYMRYGSHLRRTHALTPVAASAVIAMVTACGSSGSSGSPVSKAPTTSSTSASSPALVSIQADIAKYKQEVKNYGAIHPISGRVSAL